MIIGAILLSLLAIVPAFGADEVGFIDPGDINPSGTLSDSTPDDQGWARQGGRIGLMLSDDGLDTPVKRVLIPSIDADVAGTGNVMAHTATIADFEEAANAPSLSADDYVLIGMNTVRKVTSVVTTDGDTTITLDKAFANGSRNAIALTYLRTRNSALIDTEIDTGIATETTIEGAVVTPSRDPAPGARERDRRPPSRA